MWLGDVSSHGKRVCRQGQTGGLRSGTERTAKGTLLLSDLGLTNVRKEAGMGRAAMSVVLAGLIQAEGAVDGQADFGCVVVLLSVVLPPADRAQRQCASGLQRLIAATRTAKAKLQYFAHLTFSPRVWTGMGADRFTRRTAKTSFVDRGTAHTYLYAPGDPVNRIDPSGYGELIGGRPE